MKLIALKESMKGGNMGELDKGQIIQILSGLVEYQDFNQIESNQRAFKLRCDVI